MQKFTLAFPDPISLWQFKNQTQAINITITPKKNIISGLFAQQEVDLAITTFKAVAVSNAPSPTEKPVARKTRQTLLKNYSFSTSQGTQRLKKVVDSLYSFKLF